MKSSGTPSGFSALTSVPLAAEMRKVTSPSGIARRCSGTPCKASRMNWIHDVRSALEEDGIGWPMWDYRGGFGVVTKQDGQPAKVDQAVVEALGLKKQ